MSIAHLMGCKFFLLLSLICAIQTALAIQSQDSLADQQRRFLEVRRRQIELSDSRAALKRAQELFDQGLLAHTDLDKAQVNVEKAQLNYQQAVLSLLNQQPRITVEKAVKYQTSDGRQFVRLTARNLTPTFDDSQFRLLNNFEGADPIPKQLRTRDVQDIFISLKDTGADATSGPGAAVGTTIALPYEAHIGSLAYGQSKTLKFQLLRDVNSVMVAVTYQGREHTENIQLQQAETTNVVNVTSAQVSQEADLGSQATYDLVLGRSRVDVQNFRLRILNLPHQINYSFVDPKSQARLSEINFPAGVAEQPLQLRLFLPDRADGREVHIDEPMDFWVVVMDRSQEGAFSEDHRFTQKEIEATRAGRVRLQVIPRGVGRIEVSAASLYSEIQTGETVETNFKIRNTGSRRLDNVRLTADVPLNWRSEIVPDIIPSVDVNHEQTVRLKVIPPADVPVGDYEVRIKTESYAYNRRVPSEEKIYRISLKAPPNLLGMGALIGSLLALVVGIVIFGVKLTRR